jgi:hypothetical protein
MTIHEFPLAWRWTQPSHAVLPAEVLAGIRPLSASEAAGVCTAAWDPSASKVSCSASDPVDVRSWLRSIQPDSRVPVYVSWSRDLAVETSWDIFTEHWDDFCYPSSDDVTVAPVTGTWRLQYHHYERFDFITASEAEQGACT